MANKKNKLEPRLPHGFADRGPEDIRAVERMMATIKSVYERYGFEPVETPFVEYTEALGKFLPDQDRPNEGVFSFQDEDGQEARSGGAATGKQAEWLSLRYDLTAPLARYVAEHESDLAFPFRRYQIQRVYRGERAQKGRFREFYQCDIDVIGKDKLALAFDAELLAVIHGVFGELELEVGGHTGTPSASRPATASYDTRLPPNAAT